VSASRPSIGLATGVTDSFASTLAGFVADNGGGWKFAAQPINHCVQNTPAKILKLVFMQSNWVDTADGTPHPILLFLNHCVLYHVHAVAGRELSLDGDFFGGVLRQLAIQRLVLADQQIRFAVIGLQTDRQPAGDALLCAIGVFLTGRIVIDVAGHIDDLTTDFLCFTRRDFVFLAMLMAFMSDDWRCRKQCCGCECNDVVCCSHIFFPFGFIS
jgi:hypothetical protein